MWKPLEIFLYEWWPVRRERRACRRLAAADVIFPVQTR
jgi:vacuolar-type H+-ATPase catalytic subunit A/Vma1